MDTHSILRPSLPPHGTGILTRSTLVGMLIIFFSGVCVAQVGGTGHSLSDMPSNAREACMLRPIGSTPLEPIRLDDRHAPIGRIDFYDSSPLDPAIRNSDMSAESNAREIAPRMPEFEDETDGSFRSERMPPAPADDTTTDLSEVSESITDDRQTGYAEESTPLDPMGSGSAPKHRVDTADATPVPASPTRLRYVPDDAPGFE